MSCYLCGDDEAFASVGMADVSLCRWCLQQLKDTPGDLFVPPPSPVVPKLPAALQGSLREWQSRWETPTAAWGLLA